VSGDGSCSSHMGMRYKQLLFSLCCGTSIRCPPTTPLPSINAPIEPATRPCRLLLPAENTLWPKAGFWSSTGSEDARSAVEDCVYRLAGPACSVRYLRMLVYRAFYQHGYVQAWWCYGCCQEQQAYSGMHWQLAQTALLPYLLACVYLVCSCMTQVVHMLCANGVSV
jgi:hypothetical protein